MSPPEAAWEIDTGIAADYINRRRGVYERAREAVREGHRLGIGMPVLAELWHGIENSSTRERNAARLRRVLSGLEPGSKYRSLSLADRKAVLEILTATKPEFAASIPSRAR